MKAYLGDSVYAWLEGPMIKLYTDNGLGESNVIYLEDSTFEALLKFVEKANGVTIKIERNDKS